MFTVFFLGEKKYEFRKRIFKREDVDTIVIYSTSPCCRVVAEASIAEIIQDSPEKKNMEEN